MLKDLQAELGLTYLFISHNLAVVNYVVDRIAVMFAGRIVELAPKREIFERPRHPYTEALLAAILWPDPNLRSRHAESTSDGQVEGPASQGCAYAPRCRYVVDRCRVETPELLPVGSDHLARCHRVNDLRLTPLSGRLDSPPRSGV